MKGRFKRIRKDCGDSNASISIRWVNKPPKEKPHEWETSFFPVYWNSFKKKPYLNTLEFAFKSYYLFALKNILATLLSSPWGFEELTFKFDLRSVPTSLPQFISSTQGLILPWWCLRCLGWEQNQTHWNAQIQWPALRGDANEISKLFSYLVL